MIRQFWLGLPFAVCCCTFAAEANNIGDFTFIQVSDIHAPMAQSAATISRIKDLGTIEIPSCGVEVSQPSFVIATGDLTEFGGGNGAWERYLSCWRDCKIPIHQQLGNHDNTWHANVNALRKGGESAYYSFNIHGCHFVGLMTPTVQDPRYPPRR